MGRPVIASPLGGPAETIVHAETGWLAPPGDPEAWTAAIGHALALTSDARAAIGAAARARIVSHFSLEAMAAGTFAVYRRLLEARA